MLGCWCEGADAEDAKSMPLSEDLLPGLEQQYKSLHEDLEESIKHKDPIIH